MLYKLTLVCRWVVDPLDETGLTLSPDVLVENRSGVKKYTDITSSAMSDPNAFNAEIIVDFATLSLIEADPRYLVWSTEEVNA